MKRYTPFVGTQRMVLDDIHEASLGRASNITFCEVDSRLWSCAKDMAEAGGVWVRGADL